MKKTNLVVLVLLLVGLAAGLRLYAASLLQMDADEPVYTAVGVEFANYMRAGRFNMLAWSESVYEHPALFKIFYGFAMLTQPPIASFDDLPRPEGGVPVADSLAAPWMMAGRYLSIFFGVLTVAALALFNPLAAFFLAISTLGIKYTSEVYMEALPMFTSLLAVLAYWRWFALVRQDETRLRRHSLWLVFSAACLGATAAGKYVFVVAGFAISIHYLLALLQKQLPLRTLGYFIGWGLLSLAAFFVFNPFLWPHPISRLEQTLQFHLRYRVSKRVLKFNYPFWQPLRWLSVYPFIYKLKPLVAFPLRWLDPLLCTLAVIGLPRLFLRQRVFFYWLVIGLGFLFLWNTKWPQYTLTILVPFYLSAALGSAWLWELAQRKLKQ